MSSDHITEWIEQNWEKLVDEFLQKEHRGFDKFCMDSYQDSLGE